MGILTTKKLSRRRGFTITELLIVISVIGILASIGIVAYPGYQKRLRDSERKNDLSQLATAMNAYAIKKNSYMGLGSGCGFFDGGSGWISLGPTDGGGFYNKSVLKCLKDEGTIANEVDFVDPLGCKSDTGGVCGGSGQPAQAYMKATCTKNTQPITYFLAHLENEPRKDAEVDALCDAGSVPWFDNNGQKWGTVYGMNYYVIAK